MSDEPFYDRGMEFEFREGGGDDGGFVASGQVLGVIRDHLLKGEVSAAVHLYQSMSQDLGEELLTDLRVESSALLRSLARMFLESRDYKRAANCFEHLGDPRRAAQLYEQGGKYLEAARLFLSAQELGRAADMYLRGGQPAEAARLYEASGSPTLAGEAFEKAGDLMSASRAFAKVKNHARAVDMLQKVTDSDPNYPDARLMLGSILASMGRFDLAARVFVQSVAGRPLPTAHAAEICYRLGHVFSKLGEPAKAVAAFEKAQSISPGYRDAAAQIAAVRAGAPAGAPTAPAPTPAPVTTPDAASVQLGNPVVKLLEDFNTLKDMPLARDLSLDDLRSLYAQCEPVSIAAGQPLITEGQPGEALFIIRKGTVDIRVGGKVVAQLKEGACVGEMALVDDGPTSATAVAAGPVTAFRLPKQNFRRLMTANVGLALGMYRVFVETMVGRLRATNQRVASS